MMIGKEQEYDKIRAYDAFMDKWDDLKEKRQEVYGDSAFLAHKIADELVRLQDEHLLDDRWDELSSENFIELESLLDKYRSARSLLRGAHQRLDDWGSATKSNEYGGTWKTWHDIIEAKHPNIKKTFRKQKRILEKKAEFLSRQIEKEDPITGARDRRKENE